MEDIRIPNEATYSPVSLLETGMVAPLVSRLLLRTTLPGLAVQAAALGLYTGSALVDWAARAGVRRIDFAAELGADLDRLPAMPDEKREQEIRVLVDRLNALEAPEPPDRAELARRVDRELTDRIAGFTGQRVLTSTEVRGFSLAGLLFPFALGAADVLSGDVALFRDTGVFEPHVLAHEFAHRKGYWKELHAQLLAYLALAGSDDPVQLRSALAERLLRQLATLADGDVDALRARIAAAGLRPDLERPFFALRPAEDPLTRALSDALKAAYDLRMRLTGQNGLSDYDAGFTAVLYSLETGALRERVPAAGRIW
ncbi:MAG: DUF3810 family protein [Longimicrobiales bacterium]